MTTTRRQFVQALGASAALGALHPFAAHAQVDQVKVYFGFPAGSSGDTVARRVAVPSRRLNSGATCGLHVTHARIVCAVISALL